MSNKIRDLRTEAGYSQDRLSKILGVSLGTVSGWEKGAPIKQNNIIQLLALFGCDFNTLFGLPAFDERTPQGVA
jgi:transcriptional regulator with XRE-family HTH domain